MNHNFKAPIIKGTIILTIAGIFCRILGFYYRIFLNSHIGAYGMGMLQLILPICGIAFSICIYGFNSAISKYTAASSHSLLPLASGICISLPISILFSLICYIFSDKIAANIMLNTDCSELIKIIVLGIPFSSLHACICGYYYGCKSAIIPAASQIIEQLVRILGIIAYYYIFLCNSNTPLTISLALYGNIFGELSAVVFCALFLYIKKAGHLKNVLPFNMVTISKIHLQSKKMISYAVPLNLNSLLMHLLESGEAILIPAELMLYGLSRENAVSTYGIIAGMTLPLIMFPGAITNSLAVMLVPKISEDSSVLASGNVKSTIQHTITLCMHLGIISSILFLLYISRLGAIIFRQPDVYNYTILLSAICPFIYLKTSLSSILNGINKTAFTCAANISGLIIRIGFLILLVPRIGITGYIYGLIAGNILVCMLNYIKLWLIYHFHINLINNIICPLSISLIAVTSAAILEKLATYILPWISGIINYPLQLFISLLTSCFIYLIICYIYSFD